MEKMEKQLAEAGDLENALQQRVDYLDGEHYQQKVDIEAKPVAKETVPALATMLGEMRTEMHDYVSPFYVDHLEERIDELQDQQDALTEKIKSEKAGVAPTSAHADQEAVARAEPEQEGSAMTIGSKILIAILVAIVLTAVIFVCLKARTSPST